jgi:CRISPR-associated endonuclease/helicase Cas3
VLCKKRIRDWEGNEVFAAQTAKMRRIRRIDTNPRAEEEEDGEDASRRFWLWFELPSTVDSGGSRFANQEIRLEHQTKDVESLARSFAQKSGLDPKLIEAVTLAGRFHDLGKNRDIWQRSIGNFDPSRVLAKSGRRSIPPQLHTDYRHEFGSVLDLESAPEFQHLSLEMKDVVLHLAAAHHGRARPHFPADDTL